MQFGTNKLRKTVNIKRIKSSIFVNGLVEFY